MYKLRPEYYSTVHGKIASGEPVRGKTDGSKPLVTAY